MPHIAEQRPSQLIAASVDWVTEKTREAAALLKSAWRPTASTALDLTSAASAFRLTRYFALASFVILAIIATLAGLTYQAHQSATLLRVAEGKNIALGRAFANEIWLTHAHYITSTKETDGNIIRAQPETHALDRKLRLITAGLPVQKVKIYTPIGTTIYSSEFSQIGESKADNAGFIAAKTELKAQSKTSFRGKFSAFSGTVSSVDLVETYVPVLDSSGRIASIFELYTDTSEHIASMRASNAIAFLLIFFTAAVIFASLIGVVSHADRLLQNKQQAILAINSDLSVARAHADALNVTLQQSVKELERSNQDLQDFAQIAAHDLQEPLRKIEAFSSRLSRHYGSTLPEDGQMFVDRIQDATKRMRNLITDLLSYARLNKEIVSYGPVDLDETVRQVLGSLQVRIEETGADIRVSGLSVIDAKSTQMQQLFQNLISNALKFQKKDVPAVIEISGSKVVEGPKNADVLHITVRDNGVGFDNQFKDRLFKIFQRLHGRNEYEGTGVGLAICRRVVENHNGSIDVESCLGQGTSFHITLPMRQAAKDVKLAA